MRVWLSAEGAKTFPGPSYVSSEDGVVWLWHLLVNLYSFFFHEHSWLTVQQKKGKGISLKVTPHYHFHPLHIHLDISRAITAGSLPLHIASSQTQTGNLIYTYVILIYIYIAYIYIYIYIVWVLLTLLRKKENDLIIHSAMETWKYAIIRSFIILSLWPFSKISHPPWLRASYATEVYSLLWRIGFFFYVRLYLKT